MLKKFVAVAVITVAVLCAGGSEAHAQAAPIAYDYLTQGSDSAAGAYADFGTADGYDASVYADYAQYFVSIGEFYGAYLFSAYAADFALADYNTTGDGNSYAAYNLLSDGSIYAYFAYLGY